MPFKSDKQRKLMYAVANNPAVAKKTGISKAVADKFIEHKAQGGVMATKMPKEGSAEYKAQERKHVNAMKKAGVDPKIVAEEKREAGLKKGGGVKKYAMGGVAMPGMPAGFQVSPQEFQAPQMAAPTTQMQNIAGQQLSASQQAQLAALRQQMMADSSAASANRQASPGFRPVGAGIPAPAPQPARPVPGRMATPNPRGRGVMSNMAAGGPTKKYALGGMTGPGGEMSPDDMAQFAETLKKEADTRRAKQGGAGMGGSPTVGFKKGGRIDGCAVRGKTKGRFI